MGDKAQKIVEEMRKKRQEQASKQQFQKSQREQGSASSRLLARIQELQSRGDADALVIQLLQEKQRELEEAEDPTLATIRQLERRNQMIQSLSPSKK